MELRPGYKQTEVGVIPEDWEIGSVRNLVKRMKSGLSRRLEDRDIGIPVLTSANIQNNQLMSNELKYWYLDDPQGANITDYILDDGDILLCFINSLAQIGKPCLFKDIGRPAIYTTNIFRIVASDNCAFVFAFYLFSSTSFQEALQLVAKPAVNQASFTKPDFLQICVAIPPLAEQHAIAAALSDVDALLNSLDRLIAKKRDIKQAAMQQLLTGQTLLPGFSGEWEVRRVSDVCWFQEGPGVRNTQFTSIGVKLLNGTNIFRSRINLDTTDRFISKTEAYGAYAHFLADSGDIAIACSGISVEKFHEKVAVVNTTHLPLCMNTSTMRFKPHKEHLDRDYFCHFLMGDSFKHQIAPQATGSAQLNFGPSHVDKVEIHLPQLTEQTAIATILSDMDEELTALESRRSKTAALKQGMMQELLTGRTRLV